MKVLMFTNTFVPHLGGVTRSILTLRGELEKRGHEVMVIAPTYEGHRNDLPGVVRVPAISHVAGSDYSMPIPMSRHIRDEVEAFSPEIIHSHHPFLLGDTALRTAAAVGVPAVYTWHTRYDIYVHDMLGWNGALAGLIRSVASGYADLADAVIAPSESIRDMIQEQEVSSEIRVIPTGIDLVRFASGDRAGMRARLGLEPGDFVAGHLGRLAGEKNLDYLAEAIAEFLGTSTQAKFVLCGNGPKRAAVADRLTGAGVGDRVRFLDALDWREVPSFYSALDVFAFASLSETQGLVVAEALASGCPVVALDAPGTREAIRGGKGGVLLDADAAPAEFARALGTLEKLPDAGRDLERQEARGAAEPFSLERMGRSAETLYRDLLARRPVREPGDFRFWESKWRELCREGEIIGNLMHAVGLPDRPVRSVSGR